MKQLLMVVIVLGVLVSACGPPPPNASDPPGPPPLDDGPDDGRELVRDEIFIESIGIAILESYPIQVMVNVEGNLPTPCNSFAADVSSPDEDNRIHIDMYSLVDPAATCMAVLEPFSANVPVPLGGVADGEYTIWVNGEEVGAFNYPGG